VTLASEFAALADQLMALGGVSATLVKAPANQTFNTTTLQTEGDAPTEVPVTIVHMKATASRLSGFGVELTPEDRTRKLEFYYLRGGTPALGDKIRFADNSTMVILALSKVDIQGVAIIYQLLLVA
jgi:hypothetical protein